MKSEVLFVGQAPNRETWERALRRGRRGAARRCSKLALTGRCGRKLAELLGMDFETFLARHRRANLVDRWAGKDGKGDAFDRRLGRAKARRIERGRWRKIVLLGHQVAGCFGVRGDFLEVSASADGRLWLAFPHPSGVNRWWNEPRNRRDAARVLRGFLRLRAWRSPSR